MDKWDSISWFALGIFLVCAALFALTKNDAFIFLMATSYMLRPTLYAMGLFKKNTDERLLEIQYRSGNLSLTILIAAIIILIIKSKIDGKPSDELNMLLIIGLAARALTGILLIGNYRKAGVRIAMSLGIFWMIFSSLEGGFSLGTLMEASPGILIFALGLLGNKKPFISSVIFAFLGVFLFIVIAFFVKGGGRMTQLITGLLISVPLISAAICFYKGSSKEASQII